MYVGGVELLRNLPCVEEVRLTVLTRTKEMQYGDMFLPENRQSAGWALVTSERDIASQAGDDITVW